MIELDRGKHHKVIAITTVENNVEKVLMGSVALDGGYLLPLTHLSFNFL